MTKSRLIYIGLCNPKSPSNVGAVMRAAGCYGANAVYYSGERFARSAKYHTDTKNITGKIPLTYSDNLLTNQPEEMHIVCVELAEGAIPLPEFTHPNQALYIFGPEDGSIPQGILDNAHHVVYVPTIGCMNLAATVNVVLYDRLSKTNHTINHEERIKKSRDINNRLVVKSKIKQE